MIPYNHNIKNMDDVKKEYPKFFDLSFLNRKEVKRFIPNELKYLVEDAIWNTKIDGKKPKAVKTLETELLPVAQAKALYHFLWSIDHITDQICKYGWDSTDIMTVINRMKKAGYDPYSIDEDTAGQWIESLPNYGYRRVTASDGNEHYLYNPKGYGDNSDNKNNEQ